MKKILLLSLLAIGLVATSCQKYDQADEIDDLETRLKAAEAGISTNAIEIASAKTARANLLAAQTALEAAVAAEDDKVDAAIATATAAILKGQADLLALTASLDASDVKSSELETEIEGLKEAIEDLKEQLSALGVEVDDLEDNANVLSYTAWTLPLTVQIDAFDQTRIPVVAGVTQSTGTQSRTININTVTSTITVDSIEHLQGNTAADDINNDEDHADDIRRTYIQSVHTGVVSGTNEVIGSHITKDGYTTWVVTSNN